jgi:hypothetical protein
VVNFSKFSRGKITKSETLFCQASVLAAQNLGTLAKAEDVFVSTAISDLDFRPKAQAWAKLSDIFYYCVV